MRINYNIVVFNISCQLNVGLNAVFKNMEKLFLGFCINCVGDDAVGFVIFEKMCF